MIFVWDCKKTKQNKKSTTTKGGFLTLSFWMWSLCQAIVISSMNRHSALIGKRGKVKP